MGLRVFTRPLAIFIFSLLALGSSLYLYLDSYLAVNEAFQKFLLERNLEPSKFMDTQTWVMVLSLSILVASILVGMLLIFIYYQKMIQLYRLQQNFINGFTHELKTPLASLKLFLETFDRYEIPRTEQKKYLEYMRRDIERLADNVEQILSLAKFEDKKYKANLEELDVRDFLKNWVRKNSGFFERTKINLIIPKDPCFMKYDVNLLEMLCGNLLTNAINHNLSDDPQVEVELKVKQKQLILSFKDNGQGIASKELNKIFRKFYQVGQTIKGSGLGLYIVGQIVKIHRGKITAHSPGIGLGATFEVTFPFKREGSYVR